MQENLIYRSATPADLEELKALGQVSYGQYAPLLTPENADKLAANLENTDTWISLLSVSKAIVCAHQDNIIGMAFFIPSGNPWDIFKAEWSYIRMVGVHPGHEGRGIARALTNKCIDYAKASGEKIIALHTSEMMNAARHIYESLGFRKMYEIERRLGKRYWIYTLDLQPAEMTRTFDFKTDYILENERVLLQPLRAGDTELLLDYSIHEPDIWHFNANGAGGAENLKTYVAHAIRQREKELEYPFIVFDKKTNSFAGSTRFYDIRLDRGTIQLGFTWYGKKYQGTGLNKNCKYLLLEFAFDRIGMERVGFGANLKNERSINAMKAIGCREEGVLRSNGFDAAGNRIDSILLSILKKEWCEEWRDKLKSKISGS